MPIAISTVDHPEIQAAKLCECGCGRPSPMAKAADKRTGARLGMPQRFIRGHSVRLKYRSKKKICGVCKGKFPRTIEHFELQKRNSDGLSFQCKSCRKAMAEVFAARRAKQRAYLKWYRKSHRHEARAYSQQWRQGHQDESVQYARQWRLDNIAKSRGYATKNRHKYLAQAREAELRRRARERGAYTEQVDLDKIYCDHNGICGLCDRHVPRRGCHFDHIVPISKGGPHIESNLQPTHGKCNQIKAHRTMPWARERIAKLRSLGDDPAETAETMTKRNP